MGQYSMNAYDADIYIRQFKGLISNGNDPDGNLEYAVEAENVDTTDGFLQPAADPEVKYVHSGTTYAKTLDELFVDFENNPFWIKTFQNKTEEEKQELIDKFYQFYTGDTKRVNDTGYKTNFRLVGVLHTTFSEETAVVGSGETTYTYEDFPVDVYIFARGNGFLAVSVSDADTVVNDVNQIIPVDIYTGSVMETLEEYESWDMDDPPEYEDIEWSSTFFQSTAIDSKPGPGGGGRESMGGNVGYAFGDKAIYLSSKERGLYCIQTYVRSARTFPVSSRQYFFIKGFKVETPVKFDHIETFGERLWGLSSKDENESIYYSTPYKPFDWNQNEDDPANGAGQILEPNWDGDSFAGLRQFGNSLIAFKTHRAWKVAGVDIATMVVTEQYGFGTEFVDTVISSGERLYMATRNGLAIYDGSNIRPLMQDNLRNLWSKIRQSAMGKMRAFLYENRKYCLAVPVDSDENNTLIVYDTIDGTVFFYGNMNIIGFLHPILAQEPVVLWRDETRSNMKQFDFNAWEKDLSGSRATKWMTPWIELGRKDIQKGGHDFYFTPEVKGENAVTFTISFQTEKKTKTKQYTVQPMTAEQLAAGKQGKTKRLHFGGTGRRFRIIIETPSGVDAGKAYKWRLYGGIHLITEIDKD